MSERDPLLAQPSLRPGPPPGLQRSYTEEFARLGTDQEAFQSVLSGGPSPAGEPAPGANARERNREQTRRNVAFLQHLQTRETFVALLFILGFLMCLCTMVSFIYYWWGLLIYIWYHDEPCDQPLQPWLLGYLLLDVVKAVVTDLHTGLSSGCARAIKVGLLLLTPAWLAYGVHLHRNVEQCFAPVDSFVYYFLWVQIVAWLLKSVLFVAVFVAAMSFIDLNLVRSQRAAGRKLAEQLPQVPFSPELFSDAEEAKAPPECSICQEDFCSSDEPAQRICVTPCGHYFHTACLGEWFERDRVCPLCRHDIAASKGASAESAKHAEP